jgi:undecaprenyl-diphosphatase
VILFFWILIQIIGESLPISSSGHVALLQKILQCRMENEWIVDFLLHAPTIMILAVYFLPIWYKMVVKQKFKFDLKLFYNLIPFVLFIIVADVITFFFWMLNLSQISIIKNYFLPVGFCVTALCLYFSRYAKFNKSVNWLLRDAMALGIVQGLCLLPGISRFAGTYSAAVWLGYDRKNSFALSFLIQMPLLCAAFAKGSIAIFKHQEIFNNFMQSWILFTLVIASLISYRLFCLVARLIDQNKLWYFAFYMIIPIFISLWIVKDVVS